MVNPFTVDQQSMLREGWILSGPNPDNSDLTDEANNKFRWCIKRTRVPWCDEEGWRSWHGQTPHDALTNARAAKFDKRYKEII